ncbi:hypothetical protein EDB81DRAFT_808285 [Dactylonectria macrodidyma]|uniref:CFEM domain-containing protein n=1 Tax=Dactylonectria macrodidyma TaxID=307937 RepID=A0A9P9IS50_9HYPO|nr:hypothetical protein EDB81DRAFT_808285 [Dactylonectria macrodidyma]
MHALRGLWLLLCLAVLPLSLAETSLLSTLQQMPDCALSCLTSAMANSTCSTTDQSCMCNDEPLKATAANCVEASCSVKESLFTQNLTMTYCDFPIRDKTKSYSALAIALVIIGGLCVVQRFIYKIYSNTGLGIDDWLILATFISVIASTICNVRGAVPNGVGRDVWTLTPTNITNFTMYFYIMAVLYFAQITLMKLSLLFFYLRIFPGKLIRQLLWGTIIFNALFGISYVFVAIFHCQPVSYFWKKWDGEHEGHCTDLNAITVSNAVISIILDVWMLILPISQLRHLNLHWKKKVGISLMFCVGTFVTVISILRFHSVLRFGSNNQNPTYDYTEVSVWSMAEVNVGIICACMPAIRLLLVQLFPKVLGSSHQNTTGEHPEDESGSNNLRMNTNSFIERSHQRGIPLKSFDRQVARPVGTSDGDEAQLVQMVDNDQNSTKYSAYSNK